MRLPFVSRELFDYQRVMIDRLLAANTEQRREAQARYDKLFASYEKLRNTGFQPPPPPAPRTFADPAEEPLVRLEDGMRQKLVEQFINEGHSQTEAERGAAELFEAWHGGAL